MKTIGMYLIAALLLFTSLLSAQSMRLANSSSRVPPLHLFFRLPSAQYGMEQSSICSSDWISFIRSEEGKRLRQWVGTGAAIGTAAGIIVAAVTISSHDNTKGGLALVGAIPMVVLIHAVAGMYVGGVAGLIGYFIFDYPKRDSRL